MPCWTSTGVRDTGVCRPSVQTPLVTVLCSLSPQSFWSEGLVRPAAPLMRGCRPRGRGPWPSRAGPAGLHPRARAGPPLLRPAPGSQPPFTLQNVTEISSSRLSSAAEGSLAGATLSILCLPPALWPSIPALAGAGPGRPQASEEKPWQIYFLLTRSA